MWKREGGSEKEGGWLGVIVSRSFPKWKHPMRSDGNHCGCSGPLEVPLWPNAKGIWDLPTWVTINRNGTTEHSRNLNQSYVGTKSSSPLSPRVRIS